MSLMQHVGVRRQTRRARVASCRRGSVRKRTRVRTHSRARVAERFQRAARSASPRARTSLRRDMRAGCTAHTPSRALQQRSRRRGAGNSLQAEIHSSARGLVSAHLHNSLHFFTGHLMQPAEPYVFLSLILLNGVGGQSRATPFFCAQPSGARIGAPAL